MWCCESAVRRSPRRRCVGTSARCSTIARHSSSVSSPDAPVPPTAPGELTSRPTREPLELLLRDLSPGPAGLSPREVVKRLAVYGPNALPRVHGRSWVTDFARQFTHPLALLLWAAAGLALLTGTPVLSWAILGVIVVNAFVAFAQERQAARAVQ